MQNKRLNWIDFAKGLAIILVVYRHIMIGLMRADLDVHQFYIIANEVVYTFRMPLFFILTGIFIWRSIGKRSNKQFILNKFKTLIYPYLIWCFIQVTIQIVLNKYTNSDRGFTDYLYILYHPRAIDQFWFLYALFNNCLLFLLVSKITRSRKYLMLGIAIAFHYLATFVSEIDLLRDGLYYFIFLVIGDIISPYLFNERYQKVYKSPWLFVILLPFFVAGQILWFHNPQLNIFLFALIELIGCFLMIHISFLLASKRWLNFINVAGNYSLQIYVMHVIISAAIRILLINIFAIQSVPILMMLGVIFGCILPIYFYRNGKRYGSWILFTLDNPRRQMVAKIKAAA